MGIPIEIVLSGAEVTNEFQCAICQLLVEYPVHTSCTHVFCKTCLAEWFKRKQSCPKCQADLSHPDRVQDLKVAAPLAHRILLRVRLKCPLSIGGAACSWEGDYSECQAHMVNSTEHLGRTTESGVSAAAMAAAAAAAAEVGGPTSPFPKSATGPSSSVSVLANASALKDAANAKFELKQFGDALSLYSKAIAVVRGQTNGLADNSDAAGLSKVLASCFNNRAACFFMLRDYRKCAEDSEQAVEIDPKYVKAHTRRARALVELGDFRLAAHHLAQAHQLQPSRELLEEHQRVEVLKRDFEDGVALVGKGDFGAARAVLGALLQRTNAVTVVLWTARAELGTGLVDRALRLTLQVIRADRSGSAEAYAVRGKAMLLSGDPAAASELCKEALRLDPDLGEGKACFKVAKKAQRLKADALRKFNARDFEGAAQAWSELLEVVEPPPKAPLYAAALAGRATAQLRLKRFDECLKDCAKALYAAEDCKEAWLAKASALHALGRHEEALADLTALMQGWGSGDTMLRHAHEKADFEVRKAKRPDFYKALGAPHKACEAEIKTQYRQRALEYHPDKWMDRSAEEREAAEAHFKTLGTYLEILTDPFKRQLYDEGYDQEAIEQRVAAAQRAAHENPNRHHRH